MRHNQIPVRSLLALAIAAIGATLIFTHRKAQAAAAVGFGLRVNLLSDADPTALLNAAQIMRSGWIAQTLQWKEVESQPGEYHWERLDAVMEAARPYGFHILLSVAGAPDWARPAGSDLTRDGPPADYAVFANFLTALAERYAGLASAYEIWPEANINSRWSSPAGVSPLQYAELLRQSYLAIKAADPSAKVIAGSLAPTGAYDGFNVIDDLSFYQGMYNAGAASYFDALGVRVDGYNNPPNDSPAVSSVTTTTYKGHTSFYFRHYEDVRAIMVANGDADKMLWLTSAGWASSATAIPGMEFAADVSEQQQADYLAAALSQVQAQPYIGVILINNFNYSVTGDSALGPYSLIRTDWSARPAFVTLAQLRQDTLSAPPIRPQTAAVHTLPNWTPRHRKRP
jgi:hypothetical protein